MKKDLKKLKDQTKVIGSRTSPLGNFGFARNLRMTTDVVMIVGEKRRPEIRRNVTARNAKKVAGS